MEIDKVIIKYNQLDRELDVLVFRIFVLYFINLKGREKKLPKTRSIQ